MQITCRYLSSPYQVTLQMTLRWKIAQWFELQWWRKYLRNKDKEAYLLWKKNYWLELLHRISASVQIDDSKSVIDLGCGPAGIFIALPKNAVTAVDPLLNQYEAQTRFFKRADYPHTLFIQNSIEGFDAGSKKYDLVFCMNAINHVADIHSGYEKLKEVCSEQGTIVVSIDAHNHRFFKHLFRLIPGDILHPHQYDLQEYQNLLSADGWQIDATLLFKHEFFFDHYVMVAGKSMNH